MGIFKSIGDALTGRDRTKIKERKLGEGSAASQQVQALIADRAMGNNLGPNIAAQTGASQQQGLRAMSAENLRSLGAQSAENNRAIASQAAATQAGISDESALAREDARNAATSMAASGRGATVGAARYAASGQAAAAQTGIAGKAAAAQKDAARQYANASTSIANQGSENARNAANTASIQAAQLGRDTAVAASAENQNKQNAAIQSQLSIDGTNFQAQQAYDQAKRQQAQHNAGGVGRLIGNVAQTAGGVAMMLSDVRAKEDIQPVRVTGERKAELDAKERFASQNWDKLGLESSGRPANAPGSYNGGSDWSLTDKQIEENNKKIDAGWKAYGDKALESSRRANEAYEVERAEQAKKDQAALDRAGYQGRRMGDALGGTFTTEPRRGGYPEPNMGLGISPPPKPEPKEPMMDPNRPLVGGDRGNIPNPRPPADPFRNQGIFGSIQKPEERESGPELTVSSTKRNGAYIPTAKQADDYSSADSVERSVSPSESRFTRSDGKSKEGKKEEEGKGLMSTVMGGVNKVLSYETDEEKTRKALAEDKAKHDKFQADLNTKSNKPATVMLGGDGPKGQSVAQRNAQGPNAADYKQARAVMLGDRKSSETDQFGPDPEKYRESKEKGEKGGIWKAIGGGLMGFGKATSATNTTSDKKTKEAKVAKSEDVSQAFDKLKAYEYRYKEDDAAKMASQYKDEETAYQNLRAPRKGVMAQDLEKSKVGKKAVFTDDNGNKVIDNNKALSLLLAESAILEDRLNKLESRKAKYNKRGK